MGSTVILGSGITGLCAGHRRRRTIYEGANVSGGLCASYYVASSNGRDTREAYRFEKGGGHWIFGDDKNLLRTVNILSSLKVYRRKASVYFPDLDLYIPYPLQNHLYLLPATIRKKIQAEIKLSFRKESPITLKEWLVDNFGETLCKLFFFPFHDLYTGGLTSRITAQDLYKSPSNREVILQGIKGKTSKVGYNVSFAYPKNGLDHLIGQIESQCDIRYNKKAVSIDMAHKKLFFQDGSFQSYKKLISTIPLNELVRLCGLRKLKDSDPYTSVLVFNIGARRGIRCPEDHWVYVPNNKSGFYRIGFYSNVDVSFVPKNRQKDLVSLYVEKTFLPGERPNEIQTSKLARKIVEELRAWKYISEVEVVSPTWIDHAYTWRLPGSQWKEDSISILKENKIYSIGRYGAWKFQGILESMKDGYSS